MKSIVHRLLCLPSDKIESCFTQFLYVIILAYFVQFLKTMGITVSYTPLIHMTPHMHLVDNYLYFCEPFCCWSTITPTRVSGIFSKVAPIIIADIFYVVIVPYTVDPHISEPQLSDLPDYPNALLMKFLVHFKWK